MKISIYAIFREYFIWLFNYHSKLKKCFLYVKLCFLRGNRDIAENLELMRDWAQLCFPDLAEYEGGANHRHNITTNVYEVGAPAQAHLHYHHEMAYVNESIKGLGFCCTNAIEDENDPLRGATFISEQKGCTKEVLSTEFGQKLKEKGITYIRCLTDETKYANLDGVYNHWQR